jgi:hypothetical protein
MVPALSLLMLVDTWGGGFINEELAKSVTWLLHCDNVPVMLTTVLPTLIRYSAYPKSLEENSGRIP